MFVCIRLWVFVYKTILYVVKFDIILIIIPQIISSMFKMWVLHIYLKIWGNDSVFQSVKFNGVAYIRGRVRPYIWVYAGSPPPLRIYIWSIFFFAQVFWNNFRKTSKKQFQKNRPELGTDIFKSAPPPPPSFSYDIEVPGYLSPMGQRYKPLRHLDPYTES